MTSFLQPMAQGVIVAFKSYYLRRTFDTLIMATDGPSKMSIWEYWKGFNILHAIDNVAKAWNEASQNCMNGVWHKLWLECVHDFHGFQDVVARVNKDILKLARQDRFDKLETHDIEVDASVSWREIDQR